jgi:ribose-phosphate pyrophosphokinase
MTGAGVIVQAFADEAGPARRLADALGAGFGAIDQHRFPDSEILPTVAAPAPTTIVYRSLAQPNEKLVALLLAAEALRRNGARRLVLAAPYLCYMRQDAAFAPGQAVSQRAVAGFLAGLFDRIVTVDAHLHRVRDIGAVFTGIEAQDVAAAPAFAAWLHAARIGAEIIAGPDEESARWVRPVAAALGADAHLMRKTRHGDADVSIDPGDTRAIAGRAVALIDDICASGGTLVEAVGRLSAAGAREITVIVTHALFDSAVAERLRAAGATRVVSTDSVAHPSNAIPLAPILADALRSEGPA